MRTLMSRFAVEHPHVKLPRNIAGKIAGIHLAFACLSPAAMAGTSESSDEHVVIIGLAVFFALLLALYSLIRRIRTIIRLKLGGGEPMHAQDTSTQPGLGDRTDPSGLQLSHTV